MAKDATLDDVLEAVNDGFQHMEERFQEVFTSNRRIEKIVDSWPPPSVIRELQERVFQLERHAGIKHKR